VTTPERAGVIGGIPAEGEFVMRLVLWMGLFLRGGGHVCGYGKFRRWASGFW